MKPTEEGLHRAISDLERALAETKAPHMIIGGIAVIARGVRRHTDDVDATVWAEELPVDTLVAALARHGIVGRIPDFMEFARQRQVLLLRHQSTNVTMEVTLGWAPFELDAMKRAEPVRVGDDLVPMAIPEDLVIYKAVAWRDQDRLDIERLLALHAETVDLDRIRDMVRQFAELLGQPERAREVEELIRRANR